MDCSLPGSSVHGILQARVLQWVAIPFSRGSSHPRDWTRVSCTGRLILSHGSTREAQCFSTWAQLVLDYHWNTTSLLSRLHPACKLSTHNPGTSSGWRAQWLSSGRLAVVQSLSRARLRAHGLQHGLPCPSQRPRVCSDSHPLSPCVAGVSSCVSRTLGFMSRCHPTVSCASHLSVLLCPCSGPWPWPWAPSPRSLTGAWLRGAFCSIVSGSLCAPSPPI